MQAIHPPVAQMVEHSTVVGSRYCSLFFAAYRMVAGSIPAGGKLVFFCRLDRKYTLEKGYLLVIITMQTLRFHTCTPLYFFAS